MARTLVLAPEDDDLEEGEIREERESSHEEVKRTFRTSLVEFFYLVAFRLCYMSNFAL